MLNYRILLLSFIILLSLSSCGSSSMGSFSLKRPANPNKFISVNAACSRKTLLAIVVLRDPFHGILYARGYPLECSAVGDGSREVKLSFSVEECGTKIIEKPDGTLQFDVYMYLQYEKHVQQSSDEIIQVQCIPQDVVVSSRIVPAKPSGIEEFNLAKLPASTTTQIPFHHLTFDSWMDILRGKMPAAIPITEYVNVGEEITMLIKIRHLDGVEAKAIECFASDGTEENEQLLIDSNGCTVDSSIMPNLEEKYNMKTGVKMFYSTFKAFRFPERDNLHLQCTVLVCNITCPLGSCMKPKLWSTRGRSRSTRSSSNIQKIVEELEVFNTVEVKQPVVELSSRRPVSTSKVANPRDVPVKGGTASPTPSPITPVKPENLFCLNSTRMVAIIGVLLGILLVSLVVTICMCVRARELRRRLVQRQTFPYGRVHEYS